MNKKIDKSHLFKMIRNDYANRMNVIEMFINTPRTEYEQKLLDTIYYLITHYNDMVAYDLFYNYGKLVTTLEGMENVRQFMLSLKYDSYVGVEYKPCNNFDFLRSEIHLNSIFLADFRLVRPNITAPETHIAYDELINFLEWFVIYADNKFITNTVAHGWKGHLYIVDKNPWDSYPKQLKAAYDKWKIDNEKV